MAGDTLTVVVVAALLLVNAIGVVLVVLQLPGTWLILLATGAVAWWRWEAMDAGLITGWTLVALLGMALLGELIEFIGGAVGTRRAGGGRWAMLYSLVGAVAGAVAGLFLIPVPVVGSLIGAALGAGLGAALGERQAGRAWREAVAAGRGAGIGVVVGTVAKVCIAAAMWVAVAVAVWVPWA